MMIKNFASVELRSDVFATAFPFGGTAHVLRDRGSALGRVDGTTLGFATAQHNSTDSPPDRAQPLS